MRKFQLWLYGTGAIVMLIASCVGCVNIAYLAPSGESFSYNRLGTQKISGFQIVKDKDGLVKFKFDTQEGTEGKVLSDVAEAIKNITALKAP